MDASNELGFETEPSQPSPERFRTMKEAARELGLPYHLIVRAVRAGTLPHYRLHGARKYVRLTEILAAMRPIGGGMPT